MFLIYSDSTKKKGEDSAENDASCLSISHVYVRYMCRDSEDICRHNDAILTSMRRHDVASTLIWHRFDIVCPLRDFFKFLRAISVNSPILPKASFLMVAPLINSYEVYAW